MTHQLLGSQQQLFICWLLLRTRQILRKTEISGKYLSVFLLFFF